MDSRDQAAVAFAVVNPDDPDARPLLSALSATLQRITGNSGEASFNNADVQHERSILILARIAGEPAGCGALRQVDDETCELKRMYVAQPRRGLGGLLLAELERHAQRLHYRRIVLETRKVNSPAVEFYLKHGYIVIPNYGKYVGRTDAVCFEKILATRKPIRI